MVHSGKSSPWPAPDFSAHPKFDAQDRARMQVSDLINNMQTSQTVKPRLRFTSRGKHDMMHMRKRRQLIFNAKKLYSSMTSCMSCPTLCPMKKSISSERLSAKEPPPHASRNTTSAKLQPMPPNMQPPKEAGAPWAMVLIATRFSLPAIQASCSTCITWQDRLSDYPFRCLYHSCPQYPSCSRPKRTSRKTKAIRERQQHQA